MVSIEQSTSDRRSHTARDSSLSCVLDREDGVLNDFLMSENAEMGLNSPNVHPASPNSFYKDEYIKESEMSEKQQIHQGIDICSENNSVTLTSFEKKFLNDVDSMEKLFQDPSRTAVTKVAKQSVPVLHTFLIKQIKDDPDSQEAMLIGTFIQRTFGLPGDEASIPFDYRFNECPGTNIELRRQECHPIYVPERKKPILMSRFTFNVSVPMERDLLFDKFPFTIYRAFANIELSTRVDVSEKSVRLRPTLIVVKDQTWNNISLQTHKNLVEATKENKIKLLNKLDRSYLFEFLTPYPEVDYFYDRAKGYCPRFRISFLVEEEGMPKFIRFMLPMFVVSFLSLINLQVNGIIKSEGDDDGSGDDDKNKGVEDAQNTYLGVAATLALAAVFILPEIARPVNNHELLGMNDFYVFFVFIGLALASIPPHSQIYSRKIGNQLIHLANVGIFCLFTSFCTPIFNMVSYVRDRQRIVRSRESFIHGDYNPFIRNKNSNVWKATAESLKELLYVDQYVEPEIMENVEKIEMTQQWQLKRVDQDTDDYWTLSY